MTVDSRETYFPSAALDEPPVRVRRLHRFFERSCDRFPDAVALDELGEVAVTYRELDRWANRFAHRLLGSGIGPGSRVGLLLPRSWRTYAVLLGVLKAGAAFVPVDPAAPPERIGYFVADAGVELLITTARLGEAAAAAGSGCAVLAIDSFAAVCAGYSVGRPEVADGTGDPVCYVMYTSGSSGRPKGVEVAQSSICNFIDVVPAVYDIQPSDRVYQGMTLSFDFSIEEIWPTFARGATLVVGPNDSRRLGDELADFLEQQRVSVLYCVPTLLATIPRDLPMVRALMVGGEACPDGLVQRWSKADRRMLNTYGPTETTVTATWSELVAGKPVTIGHPMPTYSVVLLDEECRPVADGEVGEICIGGPGVARGYLGMPDKTAERFVELAGARGGGRLYRTGDLGRFGGAQGELVYLGRADSEVKIRGHRVDLGEIESVVLEDAEVESAAAALMPVGDGQQLACYVTRRASERAKLGDEALAARVHEQLSGRLPGYMVPASVEVLVELPTMASGKVDRRQLPAPRGRRVISAEPVMAPSTSSETALRAVWAEVLGLAEAEVSVDADFFAQLGGHSMLAAAAVSRLRERGITGAAIRDLYANPTVRSLAARLDENAPAQPQAQYPPRERPVRHRGRRVAAAGAAQAGLLYLVLFVISLPVAVVYATHSGRVSLTMLVELAVAIALMYLVFRWLLVPLFVRLCTAGLRPGRYRLWGATFLRLWVADLLLSLSPLPVLSGSALFPVFLRALGARIGSRCHIATGEVALPHMLELGENAELGYGVQLRPWTVRDGWVIVAPIRVGRGGHVGASAVLEPGAELEAGAAVAAHSRIAAAQTVGAGQRWAGSPSARVSRLDPKVEAMLAAPAQPGWSGGQLAATGAGLLGLELLPLLTFVPGVVLVWWVLLTWNVTAGLVAAALVGPVFVVTVCVVVALARRLVLPHTPTGIHPIRSGLGVRKWIADKLLEMSLTFTNSLYATLYTVPWLRLLGARIGRGAEVSTAAHLDPELLELAENSFVADMASLGSATFGNGRMALDRTEVGQRAFVGNAALVPAGASMGHDSLIGVHTVPPPDEVPAGSSWLGSPAIYLPRREDSGRFDQRLTYRPSTRRRLERLGIEFFRVTVPASLLAVAFYLYLLTISKIADTTRSLAAVASLAPLVALAASLGVVLTVIAAKWALVGSYRARVEPLWNRFVRRSELVTGLYESAAVPALLNLLVGTPFLAGLLRCFGAHIGRRGWLGTTYLTEFDLVELGHDVTIGRGVSLQTHLFEDRVMKMSTVDVRNGASVGDRAIVLYDAVVGAGATLGALSLAMKGEQLPADTDWHGIPAQVVS